MSAHVLLNLLTKLKKRDKMRGLLFRNKFNKFNNTEAQMLDFLSYDINIILKSYFWCENIKVLPYV